MFFVASILRETTAFLKRGIFHTDDSMDIPSMVSPVTCTSMYILDQNLLVMKQVFGEIQGPGIFDALKVHNT